MTLYHGSNVVVKKPNLDLSRESLDFGAGFYTTEKEEQAVNFAQKVMIRKRQTLEALKIKKLYNQIVFKTEKALSLINFVDSFEPGAAP